MTPAVRQILFSKPPAVIAFGPVTFNLNDDFSNFTAVIRITAAQLIVPSYAQRQVRVTVKAGSSGGLSTNGLYLSHQASSGDVYDFAATPAQILFGGSGSLSTAANVETVSDWIDFAWDKTRNLLFSCQGNGTCHFARLNNAAYQSWYKSGLDAASVDKTGYTDNGTSLALIKQIEFR